MVKINVDAVMDKIVVTDINNKEVVINNNVVAITNKIIILDNKIQDGAHLQKVLLVTGIKNLLRIPVLLLMVGVLLPHTQILKKLNHLLQIIGIVILHLQILLVDGVLPPVLQLTILGMGDLLVLHLLLHKSLKHLHGTLLLLLKLLHLLPVVVEKKHLKLLEMDHGVI
jgi:hypothetical protein